MSQMPGMSRRQFLQYQNEIMMKSMSDPRFLLFTGNVTGLDLKCKDVASSEIAYHEANITVEGELKKQEDFKCLIITVVLAALIFPLVLVVCCDWWKRKVHPIHEIPLQAYENLKNIILKPSMTTLTLVITDSNFDREKAKIISDALSRSSIKEFNFTNCARDIDFKNTEFSDFEQNMKVVKTLNMKSKLTWYSKTIQ